MSRLRARIHRIKKKQIKEEMSEVDWENPPPFTEWAKANLWIRPRGDDTTGKKSKKNLIPWTDWTYAQEILGKYVDEKRAAKQPIDCVIHKSRQHSGVSTWCLAFLFYLVTFFPEKAAVFVTHLAESSVEVFKNCTRFYNKLPDEWKRPLKAGKIKRDGLEYAYPHNSSIIVGTAGTKDLFRGMKIDYAHFSEQDFWPEPETTMGGIEPALVEADETWDIVRIRESTARGKGYYYDQVLLAQQEGSGIDFFFFSWIDEPKCRIPILPGENFVLDKAELEYRELIRSKTISKQHPNGQTIDDEQMKWARNRRMKKCGGSWEIFHQEYPAISELAFVYAGHPWFDQERITRDLQSAPEPEFIGYCEYDYEGNSYIKFTRDQYGPLSIWKWPQEGHSYCLSMDTGLGVGNNYTEIIILDTNTLEQVLHYRDNRTSPEYSAVIAYILGLYYYSAFIVVEAIDASGALAVGVLSRGEINYPWLTPYPNLYHQTTYDKKTRETTQRPGFRSSEKIKGQILGRLREYYNGGRIKIVSPDLLKQMAGLAWDPRKGIREKGYWVQNYQDPVSRQSNDDGIMSLAIGLWCSTESPEKHGRVKIRRVGW